MTYAGPEGTSGWIRSVSVRSLLSNRATSSAAWSRTSRSTVLPGNEPATPAVVSSSAGSVSWSMKEMRSAGYCGSTGR